MNKERFLDTIEKLGRIGWVEGKGLQRVAFSPLFEEGRAFVAERMKDAGMEVRIDGVGNLFGRYAGSDGKAKALLLGSHLDSVPGGGKYDGHLGVLAALEAAQSMHEKGAHPRPIEVVGFNAEEGGEMGGTFGSRAVCGLIDSLPDAQVLRSLGLSSESVAASRLDFSGYEAYIEMHIEQGPVLWRRGIPIGIPTAIVGITRYRITVKGQANHAGTTPMDEREDAMKEAVRLLSQWYSHVDSLKGVDFVCNVGQFLLEPNSAPVVPGKASFTLELRSTDDAVVERLAADFNALLESVTLPVSMELMIAKPAVELAQDLRAQIRETCAELKLDFLDMPSGAGHDASPLAQRIPSAMVFVPSVGGISHSPKEHTAPEDAIRGCEVLEKLLEKMN